MKTRLRIVFTGILYLYSCTPGLALCLACLLNGVQTAYAQSRPPVGGVYLATRFNSGSGSLEKNVFYFSPDGVLYDGLETGISAADLARHRGKKHRYQVAGKTMTIRWSDGSAIRAEGFDPAKPTGFYIDGQLLTLRSPFTAWQQLVGRFGGGESISGAAASSSIQLNADGTYSGGSVMSVSSQSSGSRADLSSQGSSGGTWRFAGGYTLQLKDRSGRLTNQLVFPYVINGTPAKPDYMYVGGTMYKRQ
jgi:hypothetical protein